MKTVPFDPELIRTKFASLHPQPVYLDNAGGTCMVSSARGAMVSHLMNAQHTQGAITGPAQSEVIQGNRAAIADLINAREVREIIFGANMTSLAFHFSRSIGRELKPGDRIVVTCLDHDANISPWVLLAQDCGFQVDWVDFDPENCSLDLTGLSRALQKNPGLVCIPYVSNVVGTVLPVKSIINQCHQCGALVFIDAVQAVPHFPVDVQELGCDFLIFSLHKLFGPHMGVLYGRSDLLERLTAYQVQSGIHTFPEKFETGNQKNEAIYGLQGVIDYLVWLGTTFGSETVSPQQNRLLGRKLFLRLGLEAVQQYEAILSGALWNALQKIPLVRTFGPLNADPARRVPIFAFEVDGVSPKEVEEHLLDRDIKIWSGHFHASEVTRRLGKEAGLARVSAAHYNTLEEVELFAEMLSGIKPG